MNHIEFKNYYLFFTDSCLTSLKNISLVYFDHAGLAEEVLIRL